MKEIIIHPRKKCADCGGRNISSLGERKDNKGRLIEYYFYCRDFKSENIFNYK